MAHVMRGMQTGPGISHVAMFKHLQLEAVQSPHIHSHPLQNNAHSAHTPHVHVHTLVQGHLHIDTHVYTRTLCRKTIC